MSSAMFNLMNQQSMAPHSVQTCIPQQYMQMYQTSSTLTSRLIQPLPTMFRVPSPSDLGNNFVATNVSSTLRHPGFLREPFFGCYQSNTNSPQHSNSPNTTDTQRGSGPSPYKNITIEELRPHFNKPIIMVAKDFNICITLMKKICRKAGIKRWPHRRIRSLVNTITQQQILLARSSPAAQQAISEKIDGLKEQLSMIIKDPDVRLDSNGRASGSNSETKHGDGNATDRTTDSDNAPETKAHEDGIITDRATESTNVPETKAVIELAPLRNLKNSRAGTLTARENLLNEDPQAFEELSKKIRQTMPTMAGALHILHFSRKLSAAENSNNSKVESENISHTKANLAEKIRKNIKNKKMRVDARKPMRSIAALLNN